MESFGGWHVVENLQLLYMKLMTLGKFSLSSQLLTTQVKNPECMILSAGKLGILTYIRTVLVSVFVKCW
jgi:hypothetical protein